MDRRLRASVIVQPREERCVEPLVVPAQQVPLHALALEPRPLEYALGCGVADANVRLDAVDPVDERVADRRLDRARGDAAAARRGTEPVAELHDVALGTE